jgi:hypothetical protein
MRWFTKSIEYDERKEDYKYLITDVDTGITIAKVKNLSDAKDIVRYRTAEIEKSNLKLDKYKVDGLVEYQLLDPLFRCSCGAAPYSMSLHNLVFIVRCKACSTQTGLERCEFDALSSWQRSVARGVPFSEPPMLHVLRVFDWDDTLLGTTKVHKGIIDQATRFFETTDFTRYAVHYNMSKNEYWIKLKCGQDPTHLPNWESLET